MRTAESPLSELRQSWPTPSTPRPIVIIGAGSIVRDAHLPVYARLGFPVAGIYDIDPAASRERAAAFGITRVFPSLAEALGVKDVLFDIAVPPQQIGGILERMPVGAATLIQKPMGRDLAEARRILAICRERHLIAAINFQLRFAPNMLGLREALSRRLFGEVTDAEVRLNLHTPWGYWAFLRGVPRLEVLMHSIHYIDLIRALLGEPKGVYCRAVRHPDLPDYPDVRSSIILDYGDYLRCSLVLNHSHTPGPRYAMSQFKVEGTRGAAIARMGVNLNYPHGEPDTLEFSIGDSGWRTVTLRGSWFLEAFEGPMSNLQRFVAGEDKTLVSSVHDAIKTMAVVEACYSSSASGATPIPNAD